MTIDNKIKAFDTTKLCRVETFNDTENAEIRMLVPQRLFGVGGDYPGWENDPTRPLRFFSSVTINFRGQLIPWNFEFTGVKSIFEAGEQYAPQALVAAEEGVKNLEQRLLQSSILNPDGTLLRKQ